MTQAKIYHFNKHMRTINVLAFSLLCLCSCRQECPQINEAGNDTLSFSKKYEVKVIDSCEYIHISLKPPYRDFSIAHKGNCKYCLQRDIEFYEAEDQKEEW